MLTVKPPESAEDPKRFLYLDIDSLPHEGFASGLLIMAREMLRKLQEWGHEVKISSIAESKSKNGVHEREEANIRITESYLPSLTKDIEATQKAIYKALTDYGSDIIFMNTPAVFFNDVHTEALRLAIQTQ